ncbi:unnamed protein product [Spirodela intermedia]|uniref:Auxin-responsive protein n=1 Tax=Spirodela intermedia TaxID=51605 RepID=A0A7I8J090_SPIIN|nr:unnamed protein product [Spirodela intermedia]CAA6662841.1 unnamed protein product [Spirodela intermedia]
MEAKGGSFEREFETLMATELTLGPPGMAEKAAARNGWSPVTSYRKRSLRREGAAPAAAAAGYVKVAMEGAPYLRKLREALESMFECFSGGGAAGWNQDGGYAITYEKGDGSGAVVAGTMFASSCKRLRITKAHRVLQGEKERETRAMIRW